jgi:RimK family alpha-L-glutamate ligase
MKAIVLTSSPVFPVKFQEGLGDVPMEVYDPSKIAVHLKDKDNITFYHDERVIDFTDSFVVYCKQGTTNNKGILAVIEYYLRFNNIPFTHPLHGKSETAKSKIWQMMVFCLNDIKIPQTVIMSELSYLSNRDTIDSIMTFPGIYKTGGQKGENVEYVNSLLSFRNILSTKKKEILCLYQNWIDNTYDVRATVIMDECVDAFKRSRIAGYVNNISQGGEGEHYDLPQAYKDIAVKAHSLIDCDMTGVDFIFTRDSYVILEVNQNPHAAVSSKLAGFDIRKRLAEKLVSKYVTR